MRHARGRAALTLARIEAVLLARSIVGLVGLLAGAILVWVFTYRTQPLWWYGGWAIGYGQVIVSLAVLIAAQLATGRAQRDGLGELYDSFPSSVGRRTAAHLIGLVGAIPACLILIGATASVFELRDVIGTPDLAVLIAGVLLVLAGGAIGVAIGTRFPHPLAGVLGAFVWFVPFTESNQSNGASTWLFPWLEPGQLKSLPGPLSGFPPATAHAVELAAIAALAAVVALALATRSRRQRVGLLGAAAAALAAIVMACVVQLQPISTARLDHLVSEVANTGSTQRCTTSDQVRYCLYPEFGSLAPSLQGPINGVLAHLPVQPSRALTISQTSGLTLDDATLTHGHSTQQVNTWRAQLQSAPANMPSSSAIFVNLGSWPATGSQGDARFDLALGAAEWAVGLPTNTGTLSNAGSVAQPTPCVPLNQAREAIAIWLAAQATHLPTARFQGGSGGRAVGYSLAQVDGTTVVAWVYPGEYADYFASPGPQPTAAGYLLAQAMTRLPADRVAAVLASAWDTWTSGHAADTQLAAALDITMPAVPSGLVGPRGNVLTPPPGAVASQPECAT
jgi:hypothetical protein